MAVYYKFKSAKDYDSILIDGHFITLANLKEEIFEKKHLGRGTDFDLVVTNAQTDEEYLEDGMLIPKNTSVLIRRVPGLPRKPIVTTPLTDQDKPVAENELEDVKVTNHSFSGANPSVSEYPDELEWDEFGNDLYAIPEVAVVHSSNPVQCAPLSTKTDEDSKIKALFDTPALEWQCQNPDSSGAGRGFGRATGDRSGGRDFGRGGLLERATPPLGYVCHRCKVPGHFIQHCPTNGDPAFDIKRVKPPTGIPKSMLMATDDGSYALPSGAVAVLKPNEAAFEKEIEGMPSTRSLGDLPLELYCPMCRAVMKDAVLTSKCCFNSYCDKCIRDHIISKSMCICGAANVLADDLLPNKTLRDTIVRILQSNNSSGDRGHVAFQAQFRGMESAQCLQAKILSPMQSATSKVDVLPPKNEDNTKVKEMTEPVKFVNSTHDSYEKTMVEKGAEISEATHESNSMREPGSQMSVLLVDEKVQQKLGSEEVGSRKQKKKARLPLEATDVQCRPPLDFAAENYLMPAEASGYNPYWNGMQPGFDVFGGPYGGPMPFMGCGLGPATIPFRGVYPQDPFGAQRYIMPFPPPYYNRRQPRHVRQSAHGSSRDPEFPRTSFRRRARYNDNYYKERTHHHREKEHQKHKANVFARISFPEGEPAASKGRKLSSSIHTVNGSSHHSSQTPESPGGMKRIP